MPNPCPTVFRQRICHLPTCRTVFYLCCHCDRGQRYCSPRCRQKSRRQQRREANRRHQQSEEGRLDHRDHQRHYRQRQAQARVTDQGCVPPLACGRMTVPALLPPIEALPWPEIPPSALADREPGWVVCQICGRRGQFLNPFH